MPVEYVMHEGQLCRTTQTYESVELGQLELDVASKESTVAEKTTALEALQAQVDAATIEVEDAESVLEDCKSGLSVAKTLVGEPDDTEEAQGVVLTEAASVEEQVI